MWKVYVAAPTTLVAAGAILYDRPTIRRSELRHLIISPLKFIAILRMAHKL